jgi:hypothetical protein
MKPTRLGCCFIYQAAVAVLLFTTSVAAASGQAADNKACKLLSAAELEPLTGKLTAFNSTLFTPDAQMCTARGQKGTVMLRWARKKPGKTPGLSEAKGAEVAKEMGAKVEVKTFGPITCSTFIPPKGMTQVGPNTTCSVTRENQVAAVEITANKQKDMVSIEKLSPLAKKLATRF